MKVQMSINDELLAKIDSYTKANYMTRSGFVSMACAQYLLAHEMQATLRELALCMREIADKGAVDKEQLDRLEDIERTLKVLQMR